MNSGKSGIITTWLPLMAIVLAVTFVYRNHFHNEFHFDDGHTVQNNIFIQDLKNFKKFFTDGTTVSNLPANQQYRPMITLSMAIDYWLSWNIDPKYKQKSEFDAVWKLKPDKSFWFHFTNFFWFLVQLILMFFVFVKLFKKVINHKWNHYLALFAVAWYGLHTAQAETINYISARSDSLSTMLVVLAFFMFLYCKTSKKYFIYLIPVVIGSLFKPTAVMFAPLLIVYLFLFEVYPLFDVVKAKAGKKKMTLSAENKRVIKSAVIHSSVSFVVVVIMYLFMDRMTPATFTPGTVELWKYMATQPAVMFHYVRTFFLPTELSADTDWKVIQSLSDIRFWAGTAFVLFMLVIAYVTARKPLLRPVSFGILWFFLALFPTSVVPLSEVMNDHRIFYPYVGLMISVVWVIGYLLRKYEDIIRKKIAIAVIVTLAGITVLTANAYGTVKRCEVWKNGESLWYDVTVKSPKNGRGLMNYGLTQMAIAKYDVALEYFEKAKEFTPYYSYLYINIGILKNATGHIDEAERNFKLALQYGPEYHGSYYYYAQFLAGRGRNKEAVPLLKKSLILSPGFMESRYLLMNIYSYEYMWDELKQLAAETLSIVPGDPISAFYLNNSGTRRTRLDDALDAVSASPTPENYLTLSLRYYQEYLYEECIKAALDAVKLKPDYKEAYNNICSAYNCLGEWDRAIEAGEKALAVAPDYALASANLALAKQMKEMTKSAMQKPSHESWLNLSLLYYNSSFYYLCIEAAEKALALNPKSANAYNNICSAYNAMNKWDEAIVACEKALTLEPDMVLAKNNLNWAKQNK